MSDSEGPSHTYAAGDTVLGRLALLLSLFVAVVLFALRVLRCLDVIARYDINALLPGTSELTTLGLSC